MFANVRKDTRNAWKYYDNVSRKRLYEVLKTFRKIQE